MIADAAPCGFLVRDLAHHFQIRPAGPVDQAEHGEAHGDEEPVQGPKNQHTQHRGDGRGEVVAADRSVSAQGADIHESPHRLDHDGRQDGARKWCQRLDQERQRHEHHKGREDAGHLCVATGAP